MSANCDHWFNQHSLIAARLLPVWALQAGATLLGKPDAVQRLCGNLQVAISKARSLLGWVLPVSVDEGLRRAVSTRSIRSDWRKLNLDTAPKRGSSAGQRGQSQAGVVFVQQTIE